MRELHLLRLFTHHYFQNDSQQNACGNQHLSIWEMLLQKERQDSDYPGEKKTEQRAFQHDAAAQSQIVALEKKNNFEALAIEGSKSKQN